MSHPEMDDDVRRNLLRWRLVLGPPAEGGGDEEGLPLDGLAAGGARGEGGWAEVDEALSFVYGPDERGADLSAPDLSVPAWLEAVRRHFDGPSVSLLQRDAVERKELRGLLFEPEVLGELEPSVELAATLLAARDLVPDAAREEVRRVVSKVVEDLRRRLEGEVRRAVVGALHRHRSGARPLARNVDWTRTIRENLGGWDPERGCIVPERFRFWANVRRRRARDVVCLLDQSGSMAPSLVHGTVLAAILASIPALRTTLGLFSTEVVDVSDRLGDPVDILLSARLGGGTDIARAVRWAASRVERPDRTILWLVSDLFEGGDAGELVATVRHLAGSGVRVLALLALTDDGSAPAWNRRVAERLGEAGARVLAATPDRLVEALEDALRGPGRPPRRGGAP